MTAIPQRLVISSGNAHKVREFQEILAPYQITLLTPDEVGGLPAVVEDGATFAANAILKAQSACAHTGEWAVADDSGIAARALDGAPGIYSARYAGEPCNDTANNEKLRDALRPHTDRLVQYVCVIALVRPGQEPLTWEGTFAGEFLMQPAGSGGFGYDPYVWIPDAGCTVAQLSAADKHRRSHRGQALRQFAEWLTALAD